MIKRLLATRGIHYLVTRFGSKKLRGMAFDERYRQGDWHSQGDSTGELPEIVRHYLRQGDMLVMGCGGASVLEGLEAHGLNSALGVDLSEEAILLASRYSSQKVSFVIANMETFNCPRSYDIILFSESLYYVRLGNQERLLRRLGKHLKPGGVFVVTLAQAKRYQDMLEGIRKKFLIIADRTFTGSTRHLIVFTPSSPSPKAVDEQSYE